VTIILGGDFLIHNKTKDPEINRGSPLRREGATTISLQMAYDSNISRLVNTEECRLYGMKSHDCHMFMQTLIPLAFRDLLPKGICDALMEISHFFRDICSSKLNVDYIEMLETNIVETLCKLEMIFPLSFFNSMEHLPIHLPFEAKVGGPV